MTFDRSSLEVGPGEFPTGEKWERVVDELEMLQEIALEGNYYTGGAGASSTGAEVALAAWTGASSYTFLAGYIYRLDCDLTVYNAAGTYSTVERIQIMIRQAHNSTSATLLGSAIFETQGTSSSGATTKAFRRYIKNTGTTDKVGVQIGIGAIRVTGAAANVLYGDASLPTMLVPVRVGTVAALPNLAAIATALS